MIETDEYECETKRITPVAQDDLERAVASLSVNEKREFVILTPNKGCCLGALKNSRQTQVCNRIYRGPRHD